MKQTIKYAFKVAILQRAYYYIRGILVLWLAVFFREPTVNTNKLSNQEKFKWDWVDKIHGNMADGFSDIYYKRDYPKDTWWSRYNWSAFRNSTHNFLLKKGIYNKKIVSLKTIGNPNVTDDPFPKNTGTKIQIAKDENGKVYHMYYYCIMYSQLLSKIIPWYKPKYDGEPRYGIRILIGYKLFVVKELNKKYIVQITFAPNIRKKFVKG